MSLFRSIATIGSFTLLSRITGFARDILIAGFLGAGTVADCFFVAFKFPNLFRRLFAEGAFNAAFVPLFAGTAETEGKEKALLFAQQSFAMLFWGLFVFVAVMELAMPYAMHVFAPGFDAIDGKLELATELSRITFPYLLFISLVSLQGGVLNSVGKFAAAAATPILLNLTLMAALLGLTPFAETPGHALAWGTLIAGMLQFGWLVVSVRRAGYGINLTRPRLTPEVKTLLKRIVPGAVGAGVYQINLLVDTIIASFLAEGSVSFLYYADRVNQLPLGVVGIAVGTALLPVLSRQIRAGETKAALDSQNRAMEVALLFTLPACAALMVLAHPIITVLFQRGAFGPAEAQATAMALAAFAIGLPATVLIKVLAPGFFARQDTKTPVKVAMVAMAVNIVLNLALIGPLGHVGIALATAISVWVNVAILAFLLRRDGFLVLDARLRRRGGLILICAATMGGLIWAVQQHLAAPYLIDDLLAVRAGTLGGLVVVGMVSFGLLAHITGAAPISELKAQLRRRKKG